MQTTNSIKAGNQVRATSAGGGTVVKSFTQLGAAVLDSEIDKFTLFVRQGIDNWRNAGKILVDMTKKDPGAVARIKERSGLSDAMIQTFARIGRNEIWPPLLVDSSLGARKLLECHYDEQKKYADAPIEVAYEWKGGKIKTVARRVSELSREECARVFGDGGKINTLDQQAFRLRDNQPEKKVEDLGKRDQSPAFPAARLVNVDIGYWSVVQGPDGKVMCEPCGRSPVAQPVRVIPNGKGFKSAIVLYYKQEMK